MPAEFFDGYTAWSYSCKEWLDSSQISVKLVRVDDNEEWYFSEEYSDGEFYVNNEGYSSLNCVIFMPYDIEYYDPGDSFHVTITNGNSTLADYTVDFFTINNIYRLYGDNRYQTSLKIADTMKQSANSKFDAIVLASGQNYPDALAGSYLAAGKNAPIILIDDAHVDSVATYVEKNLKSNGTLYILGGTGAVSSIIQDRLSDKYTTVRLGGNNRYDTNIQILEEGMNIRGLGSRLNANTVIVCSGSSYADSLSASSSGQPILIVNPKIGITDEQIDFLLKNGAKDFVIAGGTAAVPASVEIKLRQIGTVERMGGASRYETSALLAERFASSNPDFVVIAFGDKFPDGLCAGPLAYANGGSLLLTKEGRTDNARNFVSKHRIIDGYVIGGPSLISDYDMVTIFDISIFYTIN